MQSSAGEACLLLQCTDLLSTLCLSVQHHQMQWLQLRRRPRPAVACAARWLRPGCTRASTSAQGPRPSALETPRRCIVISLKPA